MRPTSLGLPTALQIENDYLQLFHKTGPQSTSGSPNAFTGWRRSVLVGSGLSIRTRTSCSLRGRHSLSSKRHLCFIRAFNSSVSRATTTDTVGCLLGRLPTIATGQPSTKSKSPGRFGQAAGQFRITPYSESSDLLTFMDPSPTSCFDWTRTSASWHILWEALGQTSHQPELPVPSIATD